jgi:hypothetical protein
MTHRQRPEPKIPIVTFARSALGLTPYDLQARTLCAIENGFPVAVASCNGWGKTSVVLATAILWFLWNFPKGRCTTNRTTDETYEETSTSSRH